MAQKNIMSNLLKSKVLLGVMIVAVMVVGVLSFGGAAKADTCSLTVTLKQGMKGSEVTCLQTLLNVTPATGNFGTKTKAAVVAFQVNHQLTADGVVGAMTRAALTSTTTSTTTTTTTTGTCPNGNLLANNCAAVAATTTQGSCPVGYVTVTPVAPTFATCAVGTAASTNGAGNIQSTTLLGSPSNVQVGEGNLGTQVLAFQVRADNGSDLTIQNVHVNLANNGSVGSTWLTRYLSGVSLLQGGKVIGSISANSMSINGSTYSATLTLNGVKVLAGATADFYLAVDANQTIDSTDANAVWTASVDSVRYNDMSGAILTANVTGITQPVRFLKLSSSSSVKVTVSADASNPLTRVVVDNYSGTVNDVSLLKFNLAATGSDMYITGLALPTVATGVTNESAITNYFKLKYEGNVVSSFSVASAAVNGTTPIIHFGDGTTGSTNLNGGSGQIVIKNGAIGHFEVTADINPIVTGTGTANFDAGDTLVVNFPSATLQSTAIGIQDQTGASLGLTSTNRQGSAQGYAATFLNTGLSAILNGSTVTNATNTTTGATTSSNVHMNVSITAAGSDYYIPRTVVMGATGTNAPTLANLATDMGTTKGFDIVVLDNTFAYAAGASGYSVTTGTVNMLSGGTSVNGGAGGTTGLFKIASGQTAVFDISANIAGATAASGVKSIQLNGIAGSIDQTLGTAISPFATLPTVLFQSVQTGAF